MSDLIQLLPDTVANQIAAGEVIQRPASAVKELLENAVDAGSTKVELFLKDSGKTLIHILDNGSGMSVPDARLSFARHATSKIRTANDLFSIRTMGFRGEALASIAAIAQVELKTRRNDDEVGTQIIMEGGEFKSQSAVSTPAGTSIQVKNLFYNVPARRNFLKSNPVEARHIIDEFERVALAHPEIAFSLNQNGLEVFKLPVSNLRQRIVNVYGNHYNERLVPVQEETTLLTIHGFIGKPEFARKTRGEQFFFINRRFIKDGYLHHAVTNAFEELLPREGFASYWLYIDIDPARIDVNIHPTKTEIKFDDERSVYAIVRAAVKRSLGQYSVSPVLDFERENTFDVPHSMRYAVPQQPAVTVNTEYNPFHKERSPVQASGWEKVYEGLRNEPPVSEPKLQPSLSEELSVSKSWEELYYQLDNHYIVTRVTDGLLIIDQQAAHERILFERFLAQIRSGAPAVQQELFPVTMQFGAADAELLREIREELGLIGFDLREFGQNTFVLHGTPHGIEKGSEKEAVEMLLEQFKHHSSELSLGKKENIAASMARHLAMKRGRVLSRTEMKHIVTELLQCAKPASGIDGKPCSFPIRAAEIRQRFS